MDFGNRVPEEALKHGYEALIGQRNVHVQKRDSSAKEHTKAQAELARTAEQLQRDEDRVKIADEMIESFLKGCQINDDTPTLTGLGRFAGWKLRVALETIFHEHRTRWFTVPELEKELKREGFDGKFAQLSAAIDAACRRQEKELETRKDAEGRQYRLADLLTRIDTVLGAPGPAVPLPERHPEIGPGEEE